jgi:hypothetical protein
MSLFEFNKYIFSIAQPIGRKIKQILYGGITLGQNLLRRCGNDGETRVRFRISREALDDHFSESDRLRPDAAFKKHRREIEGLARRKYLLGRKEPDGTVLIKTLDIAG